MQTHLEEIPRKVLGILVEHIGYIPYDCAIQCGHKVSNQTIIPESILPDIRVDDFIKQEFAYRTPLTHEGLLLFQKNNKEIVGIDSDLLLLLEYRDAPMINKSNTRAVWVSKRENTGAKLMYILNASPSKDSLKLNYLEQFDWRIKDDERAQSYDDVVKDIKDILQHNGNYEVEFETSNLEETIDETE